MHPQGLAARLEMPLPFLARMRRARRRRLFSRLSLTVLKMSCRRLMVGMRASPRAPPEEGAEEEAGAAGGAGMAWCGGRRRKEGEKKRVSLNTPPLSPFSPRTARHNPPLSLSSHPTSHHSLYSGVMPSNPMTVRITTAVASASCKRDASSGSPTTLQPV